jgi:hypothetical protein
VIYTIGRTREYLMASACKEASGQRLQKLGRRQIACDEFFVGTPYYMKRYPGGSVWATREEAQSYIDSRSLYQFAVFGVEAAWAQAAESWDGEAAEWHDLLVDAPVVKLEAEYYNKRVKEEAQMRRGNTRAGADR